MATTSKPERRRTQTTVLCTTSRRFQTTFYVDCSDCCPRTELAFLSGDTQLLYGSEAECRIWDVRSTGCLFTFDMAKAGTVGVLPYPWQPGTEHITLMKPVDAGDTFKLVRVSAQITVETVAADRFAAVGVANGQPTFLEVRDDTLWELDGSSERPLCWLPISWRRAYGRGNMIWSGPVLVFGLLGGDIGVLNINSLRRDCTSTRRPRGA